MGPGALRLALALHANPAPLPGLGWALSFRTVPEDEPLTLHFSFDGACSSPPPPHASVHPSISGGSSSSEMWVLFRVEGRLGALRDACPCHQRRRSEARAVHTRGAVRAAELSVWVLEVQTLSGLPLCSVRVTAALPSDIRNDTS